MIDRIASKMLGELPWPPSGRQLVNVGIALTNVAAALWLWQHASKGPFTLRPWQQRVAAVMASAAALWAIYHVRSGIGTAMPAPGVPPPVPSTAGYGGSYGAGYGYGGGWR